MTSTRLFLLLSLLHASASALSANAALAGGAPHCVYAAAAVRAAAPVLKGRAVGGGPAIRTKPKKKRLAGAT